MQKRTNIQISTLITFLGILTILVQFATYYFFETYLNIWGISILMSAVCCHILLEQTATYEACFNYSLITLFICLVITTITYFGKVQYFLPYTGAMLGIAVINWLIPMVHCYLRYLFNYGTKVDDFNNFYRNASIIFFIIYIIVFLVGTFVKDSFPWAFPVSTDTYNLTPFSIIAIQIEDYLYGYIPPSEIITYLAARIVAFIPYGFYITLALRKQTRLPRFFALLQLPLFIEVLQYIFIPQYCDIDDLIYALIGGILGSLFFYLNNAVFRIISGKDFLTPENDYRFRNSSLHF